MANSWKTMRLGDVTKWSSGGTPKKSEASYWDGEIPWISASSMEGHLYTDSKLKITDVGLSNGSRLAPKNSILLLVRGSILHQKMQVGLTTRAVAFNQDVKCLVADEEYMDPWYLLLWFKAKEQELLTLVESTGIGAGKFDTKLLSEYPIKIPPKDEREKIKGFGKALFDKSANLIKINQTLESLAQALFKNWFMDFDPVIDNTLAAGNSIPPELAARAERRQAVRAIKDANSEPYHHLFPSEFEQTGQNVGIEGWVPKGWAVSTLGDMTTELRRGISPKYTEGEGVPVINQRCIRNHEINFSLCRRNNPELRKVNGRELQLGDVLVNSTGVGTLGRVAQVCQLMEATVVDSHVTVLRVDADICPLFIFGQLIQSKEAYIESLGEGSTGQTELSRKVLSEMQIVIPPLHITSKLEKYFSSIALKKVDNSIANVGLEKLRDTLLPKLISGELRLPDTPPIGLDQ